MANLLVFDRDLRIAVTHLATDFERIPNIAASMADAPLRQREALIAEMRSTVQDLDKRVKDAQRACGQPETGIFHT